MNEDKQPAALDSETDLPDALRQTAMGLIEDLRSLGFRNQPESYGELLKAERAAVQGLLQSDDPRLAERGLQAFHAIESERRKIAELELAHAKSGMECLALYHLLRMRLQPEAGDQGMSPEKAVMLITKMAAKPLDRSSGSDHSEGEGKPRR